MKRIIIYLLMAVMNACAADWPQWRGPNSDGVAESAEAPVEFSAEKGVLWQVKLPGKGASTPIVCNSRIFVTCGVGADDRGRGGKDGVLCFDLSGKELWRTTFGAQRRGKHRRASGSNSSPVTDGELVFVYYKSGTLAALDYDGKVIWKTNLQERYGKDLLWWDLGTSPVLAGDNVVVAVMHDADSYVVALNRKSGAVAWKVDRNYKCTRETAQAYTTPVVINEGGRTTIVIWGADHLTGYDADDGKLIWVCGGFNPNNRPMWRVIASHSISEGVAVVPYGRSKCLAGIKIGGSGDITAKARLWERNDVGTDAASPAVSDGKAYILDLKGTVWCIDVMTGKMVWEADLPRGNGSFYSSPVLAGDKMYFCRENGAVYVCKVTATGLDVLNKARFNDNFAATPVILDDKMLLRGDKNLYCIGD
jgi:outer membrane protein assembly factor BamB